MGVRHESGRWEGCGDCDGESGAVREVCGAGGVLGLCGERGGPWRGRVWQLVGRAVDCTGLAYTRDEEFFGGE